MKKKTGGPAFPFEKVLRRQGGQVAEWVNLDGINVRDYFAARAMQAGISSGWGLESDPDVVAEFAYQFADAMLKEREK